jgi:hypothetical protein
MADYKEVHLPTKEEEEHNKQNRLTIDLKIAVTQDPSTADKITMAANAILAIAAIFAFFFYWKQLSEMRHTNELTRQALSSSDQALSQTLQKMQAQVEATNNLYAAADRQSIQARRSANYLGLGLENTRANVRFEDAPWLGIVQVVTKPNGAFGEIITVQLQNYGKSPAFNLHSLVVPQSVAQGVHPEIHFDEKVAKGTATFFPNQISQINSGISGDLNLYKTGKISLYLRIALWYEDYWHGSHFDTFCQYFYPKTQNWVARKSERCED